MDDFLYKLYNYEYFGTYLMIIIAVLVLLFIIVLFFGKKDKKKREIEETKKLQQINNTDAFKEESNAVSVDVSKEEVPIVNNEKLENDTIIVPNVNNLAFDNNNETEENEIPEPSLPEEVNIENLVNEENSSDNGLKNESPVQTQPILNKEEEKPLVFNDVPNNEEPLGMSNNKANETPVNLVDVPDFNFDEIVNGVEEIKEEENMVKQSEPFNSEVFSSVYAPEKETIELPKKEEKNIQNDEMKIELPSLKKEKEEEKIEKPILNDYNLDNINGEDYNINR